MTLRFFTTENAVRRNGLQKSVFRCRQKHGVSCFFSSAVDVNAVCEQVPTNALQP